MLRVVVLALACAACARGTATSGETDAPVAQSDARAIDANTCSVQPCSILPQCGCIGNSACDRDLTGNTACRPINVNGTETATCTSSNECERGYTCAGSTTVSRTCKKYCTGDAECGQPRGKCFFQFLDGNDMPLPNIPKACTSNCQPEDQTAALCPSTMKCTLLLYDDNGTTAAVADCRPSTASGTQGVNCTTNNARDESKCAKGYTCAQFTNQTDYRCRRVCTQPGMTSSQCGGQTCVDYSTPVTLGGTSYGVCAP